jgi:hypothetical protein
LKGLAAVERLSVEGEKSTLTPGPQSDPASNE